jgi:hypothetical protein
MSGDMSDRLVQLSGRMRIFHAGLYRIFVVRFDRIG